MNYDHKKVDKIGKIIVNSLLLVLLWGILALPVSTFSLFKVVPQKQSVLSKQNVRHETYPSTTDQTKTQRVQPSTTEDLTEIVGP